LAQLRIERSQARENADQSGSGAAAPTTPFERLAQHADRMAKASAALKRTADAGAPLYQSLTDAQKNRFKILARILRPHRHHFAFNDGNGPGPGWRGGYGPGGRRGEWRNLQDRQFGENDAVPDGQRHFYMQSEEDGSQL
jgi:LTXXQ motif family protein